MFTTSDDTMTIVPADATYIDLQLTFCNETTYLQQFTGLPPGDMNLFLPNLPCYCSSRLAEMVNYIYIMAGDTSRECSFRRIALRDVLVFIKALML